MSALRWLTYQSDRVPPTTPSSRSRRQDHATTAPPPTGKPLPDPNCTPGAISPKVTPDTLATTICRTGYTKSIRPPESITKIEKRENAAAYGYTGSLKDVEYDHLVPLEVGGDPNDPHNLWIEPGASPNPKDGVESRLHELVCEGRVPLAAAQEAIATDWTTALDTVR
jgi:hypothetical protein